MKPNAFVEKDPRPILQMLAEYSKQNDIKCEIKKNSTKMKLNIPVNDDKLVEFWVMFEKGRKKSSKGLYRLVFHIENLEQNGPGDEANHEFLCTGFLHLVKNFANQCGNSLQSLVLDSNKE